MRSRARAKESQDVSTWALVATSDVERALDQRRQTPTQLQRHKCARDKWTSKAKARAVAVVRGRAAAARASQPPSSRDQPPNGRPRGPTITSSTAEELSSATKRRRFLCVFF